jgi:hypothetical protein
MAELYGGVVIASCIDTAHDLKPFHDTIDPVATLRLLAGRWLPRAPSATEAAWTSGLADEDCCELHLKIEPAGRYREPRHRGKLCRTCYELTRVGGENPPLWLIEIWIDKPGQVAWRNARNRWLADCGVKVS